MPLSKDWREFLELLNSRGVDYVIIGAQSLAFHGRRPRYTGDLEILVRSTPQNARILVDLLNQFGFARSGFKQTDFLEPEQMVQLGRPRTESICSRASAASQPMRPSPLKFRRYSMAFPFSSWAKTS